MRSNFEPALACVLKSEGGYVNNPKDPGGMTNLGCTKEVWEAWVHHPVTEQAMRGLTAADVAPLYKQKYWDKINGDKLPFGLDYVLFDAAINSGPGRAAKWLQEVLNVTADGAIGPATLSMLSAQNTQEVISVYQARRLAFLNSLPTWDTFGKGWGNRVAEVSANAHKMIGV